MKLHKSTVFFVLVGLLLVTFAVNMAQSSTQKKQTEASCCAMDSCCKGDSCEMKEGANGAEASKGCCCCSGDSCDMKKEGMSNHAEHAGCCNGESCDMSKENAQNSSDKKECCCKSKMKHEQHMKNKQKPA